MTPEGMSEEKSSMTYSSREPLREPELEEGDCLPVSPWALCLTDCGSGCQCLSLPTPRVTQALH